MSVEPGLEAALLAAQAALQPIGKTGRNTAQGWQFLEAGAISAAAREVLTAHGLTFRLVLAGIWRDPHVLPAALHVSHPASGESLVLDMPWPVTRPGDQGRRAAHTYALKQALIDLLGISDGPDPEQDAHPTPQVQEKPKPTLDPALQKLWIKVREAGMTQDTAREWMSHQLGRAVASSKDLEPAEVRRLLDALRDTGEPS